MSCEHATITAGVLHHEGRAAVAQYCPECQELTYTANEREPLTMSYNRDPESRERAALEWLGKE